MQRYSLTLLFTLVTLPAFAQSTKPTKPNPGNVVSTRDPEALVAAMDQAWHNGLKRANVQPAPVADDSEFVRRVHLDMTGRVPSARAAREFIESSDPDKRRKLIDDLLNVPAFGQHLGISWRLWLDPPEDGGKPKPDILTPWLAQQFQKNRGWGDIVRELLTVQGEIRNNPAMGFVLANSDVFRPKPELLADSVSRMFMGVELRCAQCHNHPFADWKQEEFWGLAAFFSRVHPSSFKGGPNVSLLESDVLPNEEKGDPNAKGAALTIPAMSGPKTGEVVRARFPKGEHLADELAMPYRDYLADWLIARDNPYFAKASVNRFWFLLFGRGLVNPLDGFDAKNPAANPELVEVLAQDFAATDYDVKHLIRCICLSQAYQRTSKIEGTPAHDESQLSRMAVKPLTPEMLYDSLAVVMLPEPGDKNKASQPKGPKPSEKSNTEQPIIKQLAPDKTAPDKSMLAKPEAKSKPRQPGDLPYSRDEFVKYFRTKGGNIHASNQGIPQTLRLLNDPALFAEAPLIERLVSQPAAPNEAIETLFLAAYSRQPTPEEAALFKGYLNDAEDARAGYSGLLWILLNSSEFLLNH